PFPDPAGLESEFAKSFSRKREVLLWQMNLGPTAAYGKLHQPSEHDLDTASFRELHQLSNSEVAAAYSWSDLPNAYGFGLDHLDLEDDIELPDELQERIDSGDLFFWDADDALDFQGQLQAYGAITGRRKLPWRYRWPDAVRDDVLARLLALNAERYAVEVAQGLHGSGRRSGGTSGSGGTSHRRGRPPRNPQPDPGQTAQIGLAL
ncbi:MAG: hypothetical protein QM522_12205, partial [Chitinophagaceae bacterium]|nr:hypothetical protein [Chitinophagaceae bacterium]